MILMQDSLKRRRMLESSSTWVRSWRAVLYRLRGLFCVWTFSVKEQPPRDGGRQSLDCLLSSWGGFFAFGPFQIKNSPLEVGEGSLLIVFSHPEGAFLRLDHSSSLFLLLLFFFVLVILFFVLPLFCLCFDLVFQHFFCFFLRIKICKPTTLMLSLVHSRPSSRTPTLTSKKASIKLKKAT